jgi:hypothetical protein
VAAPQAIEGSHEKVEIGRFKEHVNSLMEQEEVQWKQCMKVEWLWNGDKNTTFFHACAN